MTKQIDIVIPCYNEAENIPIIYNALKNIFQEKPLEKYNYSLIFVDDGSDDNTIEILQKLSTDNSVKYITFSKNFGHQLAVKAGLDHAFGDAVVSMDADMQHPPYVIIELIKKWEEGNEVVGTIRTYGEEISKNKKNSSKYFYKLLNAISNVEIKEGSADFRLLDRKVVDIIRLMNENEPFLRGIIPWLGFKQVYIPYVAQKRYSGETKYTIKKMLKLALAGATAFSIKPLYLAVYLGFSFSLLSLLYIPYVIYAFVSGTEISGWASLIITIAFFGGLQLIILGIIGIYIGKIFKQTKDRPNYIISNKNF